MTEVCMKKSSVWSAFKFGALLALPFLAQPLTGSAQAQVQAGPRTIGMSGVVPDLKNVEINTGNVYDYTFASAPTDWWVQSGVWEMTNRWSCSPGWSWFGGRSEEIAAVWNKRKFSGDMSIQFYFAFKMGLTGTPRWNYRPSDVALSFAGDGKNLGSGYSLIIGADGNKRSVLMKGDKVVAQSAEKAALLPVLADGQPSMNDLHRHWWYVRINKIGSRVECYLDNELFLTYDDPNPLDAGQIALWTYNNGIMLSRVQIYYEQELRNATRQVVTQPTTKPVTTLAQR
jgi:hypothetical protein